MGVKILSWEEFNKKEGGGKEVSKIDYLCRFL